MVGVGLSPGSGDHRDCSLPKHMFGWEFVFQTTCVAPNDWSLDAVAAQGYLRLCSGQTLGLAGWQSQGTPCWLLLSWHAKGGTVSLNVGKQRQLRGFCLHLWSRVLFPSLLCQRSVPTHSQFFFPVKAPPHPLPQPIPARPAVTLSSLSPKETFQGQCSGALSFSQAICSDLSCGTAPLVAANSRGTGDT